MAVFHFQTVHIYNFVVEGAYCFTNLFKFSGTGCLDLVNGIRAGISVWPDVSIGRVPFHLRLTLHHLHRQSGWTEDVHRTVGLCEATEGGGV